MFVCQKGSFSRPGSHIQVRLASDYAAGSGGRGEKSAGTPAPLQPPLIWRLQTSAARSAEAVRPRDREQRGQGSQWQQGRAGSRQSPSASRTLAACVWQPQGEERGCVRGGALGKRSWSRDLVTLGIPWCLSPYS